MDPSLASYFQMLLGINPAEAAVSQGAPMTTPEEVAAGRSSVLGDIRGSAYPGSPEAAGPTGGIGNLPVPPPAPVTAPSLTASAPPPPPSVGSGGGGGPFAGAPSTLFPWIAPGPGGTTSTTPVPSGTPAAPTAPPKPPEQADRILQTLRGVQPPPAPAVQKVETPRAPQTHAIQARSIADMLASLGIGPAQLPRLGGMGGRYG